MINLIKGLLFGLAYVAPIGMQNLYVINTALKQPRHKLISQPLSSFSLIFRYPSPVFLVSASC